MCHINHHQWLTSQNRTVKKWIKGVAQGHMILGLIELEQTEYRHIHGFELSA